MRCTASLTLLTLFLIQQAVQGGAMAPPNSVISRFAQADCVVVGKVTEIEEKTVKVTYPGSKEVAEFQVGIVKIAHLGKGDKGVTHVKVCFLPLDPRSKRQQSVLKVDQEVVLLLRKHPDEPYYFSNGFYDIIPKQSGVEYFDAVVTQVKLCSKFLADPDAGLKSMEAKERLLATALLISTYRRTNDPKAKTELIPAEHSKAILQTLAEADWAKREPELGRDLTMQSLFLMLGLTRDDGWVQPAEGKDIATEAKKWLKENQDKYRVKKFVK